VPKRDTLKNSNIYEEMSKYCKEKVKREFSLEKVGKAILEEYENGK